MIIKGCFKAVFFGIFNSVTLYNVTSTIGRKDASAKTG